MVEETPIRVTLPACGTVVAIERSATVIAARQDTLCDANDLMNVRLVASAVSALLVASEPTSRGHPVNKLIDPSATVAPQKRKIAEMRTYQNRVILRRNKIRERSRRDKGLIRRTVCLCLAGWPWSVSCCLVGAPVAHADSQDDRYLAALAGQGITGQPDQLIADGHAACDNYGTPGLAGQMTALEGRGLTNLQASNLWRLGCARTAQRKSPLGPLN